MSNYHCYDDKELEFIKASIKQDKQDCDIRERLKRNAESNQRKKSKPIKEFKEENRPTIEEIENLFSTDRGVQAKRRDWWDTWDIEAPQAQEANTTQIEVQGQ